MVNKSYTAVLERLLPLDLFFVQIGAMDGMTFDPIYNYVIRSNWTGLLIEPIEESFKQLKANYASKSGLRFEQVAISEKAGPVTMWLMDPAKWRQLPGWTQGIATMFPRRNATCQVRFHHQRIRREVPGQTLSAVLEKHEIGRIDILQIDTEGADYRILRQLDFRKYSPALINFEYCNLPQHERYAARRLLQNNAYVILNHGKLNWTAVHESRLAKLLEAADGKASRSPTNAPGHGRSGDSQLGR